MPCQDWKNLMKQVPKMTLTAAISSCLTVAVVFYIICFLSSLHDIPERELKHNNDVDKKVIRITERSAENKQKFDYYTKCIAAAPSKVDIRKLCVHHDCAYIHCAQTCGTKVNKFKNVSRTTCFTKVCSKFKVIDTESNMIYKNVKLVQLSNIVNAYLLQMNNVSNIEVTCSDHSSYLFDSKFEIEIFKDKSNKCNLDEVRYNNDNTSKLNTGLNQVNVTGSKVYLIYFRFMSKWESFLKLPRLNTFIENKRSDKSWDIYSFDKVQSQSFVLGDNLRLVLGFPDVSLKETSEVDLIQTAIDSGFCVVLNVLACYRSEIYNTINSAVRGDNNTRNCQQAKNEHREVETTTNNNNQSFCENFNGEMELEHALYVHDRLQEIYTPTPNHIFSVSVINVPEITSSNLFDTAITELITQIVSHRSNILILMSDVGNPKFSRFDESIFLRTQTFNPLLHFFISRTTTLTNPKISSFISDLKMKEIKSLVTSLTDAHGLTKAMILSREETYREIGKVQENQMRNGSEPNGRGDSKLVGVNPVRRIKGPIECLCLGQHVHFPNDSVQVAFASLVVGSLNNKLLELSPLSFKLGKHSQDKTTYFGKDRFICDRLIGTSFNSVYHVLWKNSTYILMALHLRPASRRNSHVIRIDAEIQYTTGDNYNTIFSVNLLRPTKVPIASMSNIVNKTVKKLSKLLCQAPNELNMDRTSHREYLHFISSENHFGMKAKVKSLHYPCLFLITRSSGDSASVEAANVCEDRVYDLTVNAQFINVMPLSLLPVDVTLGPRETRYLSTLVKNGYGFTKSFYKIKTYYIVTML